MDKNTANTMKSETLYCDINYTNSLKFEAFLKWVQKLRIGIILYKN